MPLARTDVALLTDSRYTATAVEPGDWYLGNILRDDGLLAQALALQGLTSERIDWAAPDVDWSRFRCAVFRTTWDYHDRPAEFCDWLGRVGTQTRLFNPPEVVRWNLDKHYLADLDRQGVPVVETRYLEAGHQATLAEMLDVTGWDEAVIKPCVSSTARATFRLSRATAHTLEPLIQELLGAEAMMLQPFQAAIPEVGEDSLIFLNGRYSHAVRKVPRAGDFRVQDDHGGTVHPYEPSHDQIAVGEQALAAVSPRPIYGRVDLVRDNSGRHAVMELELIEPELFFRFHEQAAASLAGAIAGQLA